MENSPKSSQRPYTKGTTPPLHGIGTDAADAFGTISTISAEPSGTVLISEGKASEGIVILCQGRARLSVHSHRGTRLAIRIAGPGEVLGLGAMLTGTPYKESAELLEDSQAIRIAKDQFLNFLREYPEACSIIVGMLSQELHSAYERLRSVAFRGSRTQIALGRSTRRIQ